MNMNNIQLQEFYQKLLESYLEAHPENDEKWLLKQIHAKGIKDIKQIMFATCSVDGQVEVYEKSNKERKQDIFE